MQEPALVHSRSEEADARLRSVQRRFRTIGRRFERSRRRPALLRFVLIVLVVAMAGFAAVATFLLLR